MKRRVDLAIVLGGIAAAATLILVPLNVWLTATSPADTGAPLMDRVFFRLQPLPFAVVGVLIAGRRRGNAIAWILIAIGLIVAISSTAGEAATAGAGPIVIWLAVVANDLGYVALIALLGALVLVYPDGHLPSRRWWPVGAGLAGWAGLTFLVLMLAPSIPHKPQFVPNPFSLPEFVSLPAQLLSGAVLLLVFPILFGVVAAAIVRWRRSIGVERQQLELFVYAASFVLLGYVLVASPIPGPWSALIDVATLGLPVAVAVAVLRYRLYDIDVLINRTLVYGITTAGIAATFFGGIVVLQTLLRPFTTGSEIAVAASTLVTVALFQPLRSRVQQAVDRRFFRSRYNAARTLDVFAEELRNEVELEAVRAHLLGAVSQTMSPTHASLWLRERAR
jgi:hypothetical protein